MSEHISLRIIDKIAAVFRIALKLAAIGGIWALLYIISFGPYVTPSADVHCTILLQEDQRDLSFYLVPSSANYFGHFGAITNGQWTRTLTQDATQLEFRVEDIFQVSIIGIDAEGNASLFEGAGSCQLTREGKPELTRSQYWLRHIWRFPLCVVLYLALMKYALRRHWYLAEELAVCIIFIGYTGIHFGYLEAFIK
ncbi:hypothetical protein [Sanyastnella coralliicola]|uniref:hypothetical protein n=1 Tax=Sanyastnella coralliicola TaxID=3069118 RepID=UPI0027BB0A20|nr:hypothetical protein [Longitalea sp. SCSIO 12813]